jgi:hypothetical protein
METVTRGRRTFTGDLPEYRWNLPKKIENSGHSKKKWLQNQSATITFQQQKKSNHWKLFFLFFSDGRYNFSGHNRTLRPS